MPVENWRQEQGLAQKITNGGGYGETHFPEGGGQKILITQGIRNMSQGYVYMV